MPAQEIVDATVARLSGALHTRTLKPSLRLVFFGFRFGRAHAGGTAAATRPTATTSASPRTEPKSREGHLEELQVPQGGLHEPRSALGLVAPGEPLLQRAEVVVRAAHADRERRDTQVEELGAQLVRLALHTARAL